jgi:hypothetical protein
MGALNDRGFLSIGIKQIIKNPLNNKKEGK